MVQLNKLDCLKTSGKRARTYEPIQNKPIHNSSPQESQPKEPTNNKQRKYNASNNKHRQC